STGGAIGGHDETTYARFQKHVARSPLADRFHLEGWVDAALVPAYQAEADLGVLTEHAMYEGQLGSKNRIIQWLGSGLPVAYNQIGDLGDLLRRRNLGLIFPQGDAANLARRIAWAATHPRELADMAARARRYADEHLGFEATAAPLLAWAASPTRAPDAAIRHAIRSPYDHAPPATASDNESPVIAADAPPADAGAPDPAMPVDGLAGDPRSPLHRGASAALQRLPHPAADAVRRVARPVRAALRRLRG
ncbi:MAG: glycosyltransferase, partial [Acidobacteriota bacterium]